MSFLPSCKLINRLTGGGRRGTKEGLMLRRFGMLLLDAHLKTKTSMVAAFPPSGFWYWPKLIESHLTSPSKQKKQQC